MVNTMRTVAGTKPITTAGLLVLVCLVASCSTASRSASPASASATASTTASATASATTVWLCQPGTADDPCTVSLATSQIAASGASNVVHPAVSSTAGKFDCFYVHPRVGPAESAQVAAATTQAAYFSRVCRVWAPIFDESPDPGPGGIGVADSSVQAAFEDYLAHDNDGRPIIFIGHSEGAATLITLLSKLVDTNPGLRSRMVLAILLGGDVEVPAGKITGGSFGHIPLCTSYGEASCVIAYSSFPGTPPQGSMFGRPGQGMSLNTNPTDTPDMEVACVNPAAIGGGTADLDPIFPTPISGGSGGSTPVQAAFTTPWVTYPGLYKATCEHGDGATWLQVTKATGSSDHRPTVTEIQGPADGYHGYDVNLALGNLVTDAAAAESTWSHR
jgi:hypothetical protein